MYTLSQRLVFIALALAGGLLILLMRQFLNDYILSIAGFVGIYVILAVSLNITNGFTGLFSLGHPAFMAIGGYTCAILTFPVQRKGYFLSGLPDWLAGTELSFLPALLIGGLFAALASLLIGLPVLRLRGHYLAVATLGVIIIVQVLITNMGGITRGPLGLNGLPALTNLWWVYLWVLITVYLGWKLKFSSFGRSMLAIREDEMAADCLGINLLRTRVQALMVGAFLAGVAGGLWAHLVTAITPKSFSLILAFTIVVMVVVGGSGSISGSLLAAVIFSMLTEAFRPLEENLNVYGIGEIVLSLILIIILIYRPIGLFGTSEPGWLSPGKRKSLKGTAGD